MYSLDCSYFDKEFESIDDLVEHCMGSGMDPNYEITEDGEGIGEELIDYMVFQEFGEQFSSSYIHNMKLDKEIRMKLWSYYIKEKPNMSFDNYFKINKDKVYLSSFNRKLIWIKK